MKADRIQCPKCHSQRCTQLRRNTQTDRALSTLGLYPYKRLDCEFNFRSWPANAELEKTGFPGAMGHLSSLFRKKARRIPSGKVTPTLANYLWCKMGIPGYRCPECRMRFHSLRVLRG